MISVTWTHESMKDAAIHHEFIMVSPYGASRVNIADAQILWMKNPNVVFQTGYRIAGTPEDITNDLTQQQISAESIQQVLDSSLSSTNYFNTWVEEYQREMAAYAAYHKSAVTANIEGPGPKLLDILMAVNPRFSDQFKTQSQARAAGVTVTKPKASLTGSLGRRIATLAPGKVMDVSDLNPDGKGAKTITEATAAKQNSVGTSTLKIVSKDYPHYELAISMLPNGLTEYQSELVAMKKYFAETSGGDTNPPMSLSPRTVPRSPRIPPPPITGRGPVIRNPELQSTMIETVAPLYTKAQKMKMAKSRAILGQAPVITTRPILPSSSLESEEDE